MTCSPSGRTIICQEVFDEDSRPSEQEILDYAVKIGIDPETEKHLLPIAQDGLMCALPEGWKPCFDEESKRWYYFNFRTGVTRWDHPLDDVFKELVKKSRSEGYSSAGEEDSKASGIELKTSEEIFNSKDSALSLQHNYDSLLLNSASGDNMQHGTAAKLSPLRANKIVSMDHRMLNLSNTDGAKETRLHDRRGVHKTSSNPLSGRPPLPPKRGSGSGGANLLTSPMRSVSLDFSDSGAGLSNQKLRDSRTTSSLAEQHHTSRFSSPNRDVMQSSRSSPSPTRIDIDTMGIVGVTTAPTVQDKVQPPKPSVKGLTLTGRGSMFLKSKQKQGGLPHNVDNQQSSPVYNSKFNLIKEVEQLESPSYEQKKLLDSPSSEHKNITELLFENKKIDSDLDELDTPRGEGTLQLRDQELSRELREDRKKSVRFADFEKKPLDIRFQVPDSDETASLESENQHDDIDNWMSDEENLEDKIISQAKLERNNFKSTESVDHRDTSLEQALEKRIKSSSNAAKDNRRFVICETSDDTDLAVYSIRKVDNDLVNRLTQIKDYGQDVNTGDDLIVKEHTMETKMLVSSETVDNKNAITCATDTQSYNANTKSKNTQIHVLNTANAEKEDHVTMYMKNDNDLRSPEWDSEHNKIVKDTNKMKLDKLDNEAAASDVNRIKTSTENNVETLYLNSNNRKLTATMDRNDNNIQNTNKSSAKVKQHMSKVDINKVFESVHEILINSAEHSDMDDDVMNTMMSSTNLDMEENEGNIEVDMAETKPVPESPIDEDILKDSRQTLRNILEEKLQAAKKELDEEFILKKQQLEETVEKSISELAFRLEEEKRKKENALMISHKHCLEDLENELLKEREVKFKELREQHETFVQEQENRICNERKRIEEETNQTILENVTKLAKFVEESKVKEEEEIARMQKESQDRIKEMKTKIETEEAEYEEKHKQELAIVKSEFEKMVSERQAELKAAQSEKALLLEDELKVMSAQHEAVMKKTIEQHQARLEQFRAQCQQEEESIKKQHAERMEALTAQLNKQAGEKVDLTQLNREFEKVRCEKRLIEDKYRMLKEKYVRLKSEVRLSMERKRQAKLNRQLQLKQQQRDTTSTTEDTTERSTDVTKNSDLSSREQSKQTNSITLEHEQKLSTATKKREERKSPPIDKSLAGPLENLRKQLEKLEELEEQFPPSTHTDTYLRYPFTDPATASSELEFYRHRLHLERESVQRARQALAEQKHMLDTRQLQFRHSKPQSSLHQLYQDERELTDMEISLHRTRALLGEKIIRLRYLEQSLERADPQTTHHSPSNTLSEPLGATDSSGFSGSDLDLSSSGHVVGGGGGVGPGLRSDRFWTDASFNVLQSLENINSEIREIWAILGKQQIPGTGLGPPPLLHYSELNRPLLTNPNAAQLDIAHRYNSVAPRRATDIAEKTRGLKEWLMRAKDQHSHHGT